MRGGKLDRVVKIEVRTRTRGLSGELVDSWAQEGHPQFAEYLKSKGIERYLGQQLAATVSGAFRLRWFPNLIDVYPDTHRVRYTTPSGAETVCLIKGASEIGRREGVIIYWDTRTENPDSSDIPDADED